MLALVKNNKGFNVLELIITLVIIGIVSAVAYPNFSDWRKERDARGSVIKIKNAIQAINSQVKRGLYGFVQVHVESTNDKINLHSLNYH